MKKLFIALTSLCLLCSMFSCGPSKAEQEAREKEVADSIANAEQEAKQAAIEKARQDSIDWVNFTSKDLEYNELHGHVKTMVHDNYTTYEYSEDGTLLKVNGKDPFKETEMVDDSYRFFKRDRSGYIVSEEYWEEGTDYVWKDGRIITINSFNEVGEDKISIKYDENGRQTGFVDKFTDNFDGTSKTVTCKYTYVSVDEMGNWTKRTRSTDGSAETRKITYYER